MLWLGKGSASSTPIKEPSQVDFPCFLMFSGSVPVVNMLGSKCSLQTIPHGHPHSVLNSVVFQSSLPSILCFLKIILEVLDVQSNCEEYICILYNQFPLLTLYISGTFIQLSEPTLKQYY